MTQTLSPCILSTLLLFSNPFSQVYKDGCPFCWVYKQVEEKKEPEKKEPEKKIVEREYRILHFTASWCVPCKIVSSNFDWMRKGGWKVGSDFSNHVQVIDSDMNPDLVSKYRVLSLPSSLLLNEGKVVKRIIPSEAKDLIDLYNDNID